MRRARPRSRVPRAACALGVVAAAGCAPWYRDDELRALRALDHEAMAATLAACEAESATDAATACYERAVATSPRSVRALVGLARVYVAAGRDAEARVVADHALALVPNDRSAGADTNAYRALVKLVIHTYARAELYALALGHFGDAAISIEQAAAEFPKVYGKLQRASDLSAAGKLAEALDAYAEWLADYGIPDHALVRGWADAVLVRCADLTAEYVTLGDADLAAGNDVGALTAYGLAYRYLPSDAFALLRPKLVAVARRNKDATVVSPAAAVFAAEGADALAAEHVGPALRAYRRAVAAAPHWAEAQHNLAALFAALEMYEEAVRAMDFFLELAPDAPAAAQAAVLRAEWAGRAKPGR